MESFTLSLSVGLGLGNLAGVAGGLLIYFTIPNQALLRAALGRGLRFLGGGLLAVGLATFLACLGAPAALAPSGVALMLTLLVAPFVFLLKEPRTCALHPLPHRPAAGEN